MMKTSAMTSADIIDCRLRNHHLAIPDFNSPHDVVSHMGAVQAQDFSAAKWSVGLRMKTATDASIEQAFNDGSILRTHMMRPTWHFIAPEDIRWIQTLTAPRVQAANARRYRELDLDPELLERCAGILQITLRGNAFLTRREIALRLQRDGISTDGQRLAYILMHAELTGLVCSGPRLGKQFTYALLEERVPEYPQPQRDEALVMLAKRYFDSHGPAQAADFAWWSGLGVRDARTAIDFAGQSLATEITNGKTYWYSPDAPSVKNQGKRDFLLSIYDEYAIGYHDRSDLSDDNDIERMISRGAAYTSIIIMDGKITGAWKHTIRKDKLEIALNPFRELTRRETASLEAAAVEYGRFFNLQVVM